MFAIPGILGILFFIYLRPQEAFEALAGVPFLYMFFALILFGAAVDLRLRITKAVATPTLPWALAFFVWSLLSVAIMKSDQLIAQAVQLTITITIFVVIAQSIQSFHVLEKVATMLIVLSLVLTLFGIEQSMNPMVCVKAPVGDDRAGTGEVTDKLCQRPRNCYDDNPDPGADYLCEHPGVLGTHSAGGRVRYRGVLQDPNELAVALSSGLALLFALYARSRKRALLVVSVVSFVLVAWAMKATGSRSGQLGFLLTLVAFMFWKYRWKIAVVLGPLALPALLFIAKGGGDRADADSSTEDRYEAWRTGLEMFQGSPVWGVGFGQYTEYHHLTAHNTYVLVLGELGFVGVFIFSMLVWITIKIPLTAARRYRGRTAAFAAEAWAIGLLGAMGAVLAGGLFLSFAYHYVLWIFMGLAGGFYVCCKEHDPGFEVKVRAFDVLGVFIVDVLLFFVIHVLLRAKGF